LTTMGRDAAGTVDDSDIGTTGARVPLSVTETSAGTIELRADGDAGTTFLGAVTFAGANDTLVFSRIGPANTWTVDATSIAVTAGHQITVGEGITLIVANPATIG